MKAWLERYGLAQYAEAFERNDIDRSVLRELSESDFESLGVSLGHRKRLLRALATGDDPDDDPAAGIVSDDVDAASWERRAGERKPVTLLFADVAGSTALTETLDAEDAHERLYGAVQQMCEAIEAERGTVCRFMGDGVFAMFGAPVAYEDHARRACAAALNIQARLRAMSIEARVGLHSGEVVVLEVGDPGAQQFDASGPCVALAARMEQTAAPGSVQLTASAYQLVEADFEAVSGPPVNAKGFTEPVPVMRLERSRPSSAARRTTPFIGRRSELGQLRSLLDVCAASGAGRIVLIRGEPGIGKSRLTERLCDEGSARGFRVHRAAALDFGSARGKDPARMLVHDVLGLAPDDDEHARARAAELAHADGHVPSDRLAHLRDLLAALGRTGDSASAYQAAAALESDNADRCRALLGAADALRTIGRYEAALALLDQAEQFTHEGEGLPGARVRVHYLRGNVHFVRMEHAACELEHRRALHLARDIHDAEMEGWALSGLVRSAVVAGRMLRAEPFVTRLIELCDAHGFERLRYSQIHMLGFVEHMNLHWHEALAAFRVSVENAPRVGVPRQAILGALNAAKLLLDMGQTSEAAAFARTAIELSREVGEQRYAPMARANLILAEEPDPAQAKAQLREIWSKLDTGEQRFAGWAVLSGVLLSSPDSTDLAWVDAKAEMDLERCNGQEFVVFMHCAIAVYLRLGRVADAVNRAARLEAFLGEDVSPLSSLVIRAARARADAQDESTAAIREEAQRIGYRRLLEALDTR